MTSNSQNLSFKKDIAATDLESAITRVSEALKTEGFGVLTRIDFHTKMKEKLQKDMKPVVILGACNPGLAYAAYEKTTDVAGLLPCNAVVTEVATEKYRVELTKPSAMMRFLENAELVKLAESADSALELALSRI